MSCLLISEKRPSVQVAWRVEEAVLSTARHWKVHDERPLRLSYFTSLSSARVEILGRVWMDIEDICDLLLSIYFSFCRGWLLISIPSLCGLSVAPVPSLPLGVRASGITNQWVSFFLPQRLAQAGHMTLANQSESRNLRGTKRQEFFFAGYYWGGGEAGNHQTGVTQCVQVCQVEPEMKPL